LIGTTEYLMLQTRFQGLGWHSS